MGYVIREIIWKWNEMKMQMEITLLCNGNDVITQWNRNYTLMEIIMKITLQSSVKEIYDSIT